MAPMSIDGTTQMPATNSFGVAKAEIKRAIGVINVRQFLHLRLWPIFLVTCDAMFTNNAVLQTTGGSVVNCHIVFNGPSFDNLFAFFFATINERKISLSFKSVALHDTD